MIREVREPVASEVCAYARRTNGYPALVVVAIWVAAAACHVDPPPPPVATCSEVADHVYALLEPKTGRARAIHDTVQHRCDADFWSERTRNCIAEEPALDARRACRDTLTTTQRTRLDAALAAVSDANGVASPRRPEPSPCPAMVPECVALCSAFNQLADCQTRWQPAARDMLKQSWVHEMFSIAQLPADAQRQVCDAQLQSLPVLAACHP